MLRVHGRVATILAVFIVDAVWIPLNIRGYYPDRIGRFQPDTPTTGSKEQRNM
jgi:hypothetical protein